MLASPEVIVATWRQLRRSTPQVTENEVREALSKFDDLWAELFPAEQSRIVALLIDRVVVCPTKVDVRLLIEGFSSLVGEMKAPTEMASAA